MSLSTPCQWLVLTEHFVRIFGLRYRAGGRGPKGFNFICSEASVTEYRKVMVRSLAFTMYFYISNVGEIDLYSEFSLKFPNHESLPL